MRLEEFDDRYFNYSLGVRTEDAAHRSLKRLLKTGKLEIGWVSHDETKKNPWRVRGKRR